MALRLPTTACTLFQRSAAAFLVRFVRWRWALSRASSHCFCSGFCRQTKRGPSLLSFTPLSLRSAACGSESWMRPRFRSILKLAFGNPRLQSSKCFFDLGHKATPDGLLFIHPSGRAAQVIGLFASRNLDLLDLHFCSHP